MNISSALKMVKDLRQELKRLIKMRNKHFVVVIPKESNLEDVEGIISFGDLTKRMKDLMSRISLIREKILITNINTLVNLNEGEISLALLKLRIDDTRSELAQLQNLDDDRSFSFDSRRRLRKTEEEEKEVRQLNDLQLEALIKELEDKKRVFEDVLESANATTELL